MSDAFLGEVLLVGFNFAPKGFAFCNGQILPISQNTALFSLLGVNFGGDGRANFALPDLQGCVVAGQGSGAGLTPRIVGDAFGEPAVTLLPIQIPAHTHAVATSTAIADRSNATGNVLAQPVDAVLAAMPPSPVPGPPTAAAGGGQPHNNLAPTLVLNFVIALQGVFPARP
jgi:microcystin-dependent protein